MPGSPRMQGEEADPPSFCCEGLSAALAFVPWLRNWGQAQPISTEASSPGEARDGWLPPGLARLVEQLRDPSVLPFLHELPNLSDNAADFGDYFGRSVDPQHKNQSWWDVRWEVLSLISSYPALKEIDLSHCGITKESEVQLLRRGLEGSQALECLALSFNTGFGTEAGCLAVCAVLRSCPRLYWLTLGKLGMQPQGLRHILETLGSRDSLLPFRRLEVWGNKELGDAGANLLAAFLSDPHASADLKHLSIAGIGMSVKGAAPLSAAVAANHTLAHLGLGEDESGSTIGEGEGPTNLLLKPFVRSAIDSRVCASPPSSITGLEIIVAREAGVAARVSEILATYDSLYSLILGNTKFTLADWQMFFKSLCVNAGLETLYLDNCDGLEEAYSDLEEVIRTRNSPLQIFLPSTFEERGKGAIIKEALSRELNSRRLFLQDCGFNLHPLPSHDAKLHVSGSSSVAIPEIEPVDLPPQLNLLIQNLQSVPPSLNKLPNLQNVEEFGDYFAPTYGTNMRIRKSGVQQRVRMRVYYLIGTCSSLTSLDLSTCCIDKEVEVDALCSGLQGHRKLEALVLDNNKGFGTEYGCTQVAGILKQHNGITKLSLGNIGLKAKGVESILRILDQAGVRLEIQHLQFGFNPELGADVLAAFILAHASKSLETFGMSMVGLSIEGANKLGGLLQISTLQSLSVGGEEWRGDGPEGPLATLLRQLVRHWKPPARPLPFVLEIVSAEEKGLAQALGELLQLNYLTFLGIFETRFSVPDWKDLIQSLHYSSRLFHLSLDRSFNLEHVVEDLVDLVRSSPKPPSISLHGTSLEKDGREQLVLDAYSAPKSFVPAPAAGVRHRQEQPEELAKGETNISATEELRTVNPELNGENTAPDVISPRSKLLSRLASCVTLVDIDLSSAGIERDDDVTSLCEALCTNRFLQSLNLSFNPGFGSESGCDQLSVLIRRTCTLLKLDLRMVGMSAKGLCRIFEALKSNSNSVLRELCLGSNYQLGDAGAELIAEFLRTDCAACSKLSSLDLANIRMGSKSAKSLAIALIHNRSLEKLEVGEYISYDEVRFSAGNIPGENLYFSFGNVSQLVISHAQGPLASLLSHCVSFAEERDSSNGDRLYLKLKSLHLHGNETDLSEHVSMMLKANNQLLDLGLHTGKDVISGSKWQLIFRCLHKNDRLVCLDLTNSSGLELAMRDLLQLLEVNLTIRDVRIQGTSLERSGGDALVQEALRRNESRRTYLSILRERFVMVEPKAGRLFLCGHPAAGKTTLWSAMADCLKTLGPRFKFWRDVGPFDYTCSLMNDLNAAQIHASPPVTQGIEIHDLEWDDDLKISVWDLAGQMEYHVLHQCLFPSSNYACMFLFVFNISDPRASTKLKDDLETMLLGELRYWLRFIVSNSNGVCPHVTVVLTHFDEVAQVISREDISDLVQECVLEVLREQFKDVVNLSEAIYIVGVKGADGFYNIPAIIQHVFGWFRESLSNLPEIPQACGEVSRILKEYRQGKDVCPIMELQDFKSICVGAIVKDHGEVDIDEDFDAVVFYLHDVGEIVYFKDLECMVIDPHWFAHTLLGQVINSRTHGKLHHAKGIVRGSILRRFLHRCLGARVVDDGTVELLVQIMTRLNLCYQAATDEFFVPALLQDPDGKTWRGERQLKWPSTSGTAITTCFGRRLVCHDPVVTFLIPGLFPRFQVGFKKLTQKDDETREKPSYKCDVHVVSWSSDGFDVLVESSGDTDTYMDILVRSSGKTHVQNMMFIEEVVADVKTFCARLNPSVALSEAILRPDCVRTLNLFSARKDQAVLIEVLRQLVLERYSQVKSLAGNIVEYVIDLAYSWPAEGSGPSSDPVVCLLGVRESFKVLTECRLGSRMRVSENYDLDEFTSSLLRDRSLHIETGMKEALLKRFMTKDQVDEESSYPCTSFSSGGQRGLALIISMEQGRGGGAVDRGRLETLAKALSFEPVVLVDCSRNELLARVRSILAYDSLLQTGDCFLCCIDAHGGVNGGRHYILDRDGAEIFLFSDILDPIKRSPQLFEKPKVFFVTACRGELHYPGSTSGFSIIQRPLEHPEEVHHYLQHVTDTLLVFSTSDGAVSWREDTEGSNFVIALVEAIIENRHTTDVLSIMNGVIYTVTSMGSEYRNSSVGKTTGPFYQCPVVQHTLRKRLYWRDL